jgi:hypothetical protein
VARYLQMIPVMFTATDAFLDREIRFNLRQIAVQLVRHGIRSNDPDLASFVHQAEVTRKGAVAGDVLKWLGY